MSHTHPIEYVYTNLGIPQQAIKVPKASLILLEEIIDILSDKNLSFVINPYIRPVVDAMKLYGSVAFGYTGQDKNNFGYKKNYLLLARLADWKDKKLIKAYDESWLTEEKKRKIVQICENENQIHTLSGEEDIRIFKYKPGRLPEGKKEEDRFLFKNAPEIFGNGERICAFYPHGDFYYGIAQPNIIPPNYMDRYLNGLEKINQH